MYIDRHLDIEHFRLQPKSQNIYPKSVNHLLVTKYPEKFFFKNSSVFNHQSILPLKSCLKSYNTVSSLVTRTGMPYSSFDETQSCVSSMSQRLQAPFKPQIPYAKKDPREKFHANISILNLPYLSKASSYLRYFENLPTIKVVSHGCYDSLFLPLSIKR